MMKRKSKRALSMVLASSMVLSMSGYTAFGAEYNDIKGHWAANQINTWSDYGVISGFDGEFRPDASITRGEMAVLIDRVMRYKVKAENTFTDLDQAFYTDPILRANNAGVIKGSDGQVRPTDKITRQEAAVLMCQAFGIKPTDVSSKNFSDSKDIGTWAAGYVNALSNAGHISGKGNNDFDPTGNITRAEAAQILNSIVKGFYYKVGTYSESVPGTVVVNTPNTILKGSTITGDLIIAEGVGEGDITLDNVKVAGRVIVRGGGQNSIKIIGNSQIGTVIVAKRDGNVSIKTSDGATVEFVYIEDGSKDVIVTGTINKLQVDAANTIVTAVGATIKTAEVTKASATLILDKDSKADLIKVAETASNAKITVNGEVKAIDIAAPGVSLTTGSTAKVDRVTVAETAINTVLNINGVVNAVNTAAEGTSVTVNKDGKIGNLNVAETAVDTKVDVKGTITNIKTDAPKTSITVSGTVKNIDASKTATGMKVTAEKDGVINTITSDAANTTVTGEGRVDNVKINGNNSTVNTKGTKVEVGSGVTGTKVGDQDIAGGTSSTVPGTGGGTVPPISSGDGYGDDDTKSNKKIFESFKFTNALGDISVDNTSFNVVANLVYGTDVTGLIAEFTVSKKATATVGGVVQESGRTANDFTNPVTYTLTAENKQSQNYTVTVNVKDAIDAQALRDIIAAIDTLYAPNYKTSAWNTFIQEKALADAMPETNDTEVTAKYMAYKNAYDKLTTTGLKETPQAPTGLTGVSPTTVDGTDGKITGLSPESATTYGTYQYKGSAQGVESYQDVTGTEITNLKAGDYSVRFKGNDNYKPSPETTVTVAAFKEKEYKLTFIDDTATNTRTFTVKDEKGVELKDYLVIAVDSNNKYGGYVLVKGGVGNAGSLKQFSKADKMLAWTKEKYETVVKTDEIQKVYPLQDVIDMLLKANVPQIKQ